MFDLILISAKSWAAATFHLPSSHDVWIRKRESITPQPPRGHNIRNFFIQVPGSLSSTRRRRSREGGGGRGGVCLSGDTFFLSTSIHKPPRSRPGLKWPAVLIRIIWTVDSKKMPPPRPLVSLKLSWTAKRFNLIKASILNSDSCF